MTDKRTNDLLLACGLMKWHGKKLHIDVESWIQLKAEYCLDIENVYVTQGKLIGKRVPVVRVGGFKENDPFNALTLVKDITAGNYKNPRMRFTAERTAFWMDVAAHMPIQVYDDDSETEDESIGAGARAASAAVEATAAAVAAPATTESASPAVTTGARGGRHVICTVDSQN